MVLDVKAMEWAAENGIDTAKLKAAKIPIFGKWYFPDLPPRVPLVNLKTGEIQTFSAGMRAGEILYVARADLRRARLGPYASLPDETEVAAVRPAAAVEETVAAPAVEAPVTTGEVIPEGIHMPGPSIFPLVLGLGLSIALLGLAVGGDLFVPGGGINVGTATLRMFIFLLGLVYLIVGGVGWALENYRDGQAAAHGADHGHDATEH